MVLLENPDNTYIQVSRLVANELNRRKLAPRESYEDVLRRLLKLKKRVWVNNG